MKCLNCNKELKQVGNRPKKFCSAKCRLAYFRNETIGNETIGKKTNETIGKGNVETIEKQTNETIGKLSYTIVEGEKVYGRQAVIYEHEKEGITNSLGGKWNTRPEPENRTDMPDSDNRCIYKRKNGTRYLIDALGNICPL